MRSVTTGVELGSFSDRANYLLRYARTPASDIAGLHESLGLDQSRATRWRRGAKKRMIPKECIAIEAIQFNQRYATGIAPLDLAWRLREFTDVSLHYHRYFRALYFDVHISPRVDRPVSRAELRYLSACDIYIDFVSRQETRPRKAKEQYETTTNRLRRLSGVATREDEEREFEKEIERERMEEQKAKTMQRVEANNRERRAHRDSESEETRRRAAQREMDRHQCSIDMREQRTRESNGRQLGILEAKYAQLLRVERLIAEEPDADFKRIARRMRIKFDVARSLMPTALKLPEARRLIADRIQIREIKDGLGINLELGELLYRQHLSGADECPTFIPEHDDVDERIALGVASGLTSVEIGEVLGLTAMTIQKRRQEK